MPLGEARSLQPTSPSRHQRSSKRDAEPQLVFLRADPVADRLRLQELAFHCQKYSPLAGLEDGPHPESLWCDLSGSETLFGGEQGLIKALLADLAQQGIAARIAVADSWGAAWAVSHFAEPVVSFVSPGQQVHALLPLPIEALRIPDHVVSSLRTLDVSTIGRLMKLPSTSLPSRFGKELVRRLDQALGLTPELLTAERLVEPIIADYPFEEPVTDRQTLDHVCEILMSQILKPLDERKACLRELKVSWQGTKTEPVSLRLLRPTTNHRYLLELLRLQCERYVFTSGVTGVRMEVVELGLPPIRQTTLFEDDPNESHQRALAELVERLSSRLGRQSVLRPALRPDPQPEFASTGVAWIDSRPSDVTPTTFTLSQLRCRPLRLLRSPQPLRIQQFTPEGWPCRVGPQLVERVSGPERIETGWWRGPDTKRDYFRLDLKSGAAWWVFHDRNTGHWFLHGLFE